MGCCTSEYKKKARLGTIKLDLKDAIEKGIMINIQEIINQSVSLLNEILTTHEGIEVNPLGYAFYRGKFKVFMFLHKNLGASIETMEEIFMRQGINPIDILFDRDFAEILKYYLPLYLSSHRNSISFLQNNEIAAYSNNDSPMNSLIRNSKPAIQLACQKGHTNIHKIGF